LFQLARLNFPSNDPLEPSFSMALIAVWRSTASFAGPWPIRVLSCSSFITASNRQEDRMPTARKITVEVPAVLLTKAQKASGAGITQTILTGLEMVATGRAYERLLQLQGKARFSRTLEELKADR
jgi:hypothetical protein